MRYFWNVFLSYLLGWFIAIVIWLMLRTGDVIYSLNPDMGFMELLRVSPLLLIVSALFYGATAYVIEFVLYGNIRLRFLFFVTAALQSLLTVLLLIIGYYAFSHFNKGMAQPALTDMLLSHSSIAFAIYAVVVNFIITYVRQTAYMIGTHRIGKIIRGGYYYPQEEDILFMFSDLNSSVSVAQTLGRVKYSRFLQDCFRDLEILYQYGGRVYQYVGDELVMSWMLDGESDDRVIQRAVDGWQACQKHWADRRAYYLEEYGIIPSFKTGLHAGRVVTAEIGRSKRDIAHHGDAINTAARICGYAGKDHADLLVSETVYAHLRPDQQAQMEGIGEIQLRGREESIPLYRL